MSRHRDRHWDWHRWWLTKREVMADVTYVTIFGTWLGAQGATYNLIISSFLSYMSSSSRSYSHWLIHEPVCALVLAHSFGLPLLVLFRCLFQVVDLLLVKISNAVSKSWQCRKPSSEEDQPLWRGNHLDPGTVSCMLNTNKIQALPGVYKVLQSHPARRSTVSHSE